jgi:biopolymer transport protein ExbD
MGIFEAKRRKPAVNLSALIDIAFILVIFIVLGATFERIQDIEVTLPEANATSPADSTGLQITVHADGSVDVDGTTVAASAVRDRLVPLALDHDSLLLVADRDASVQAAVQVLADAQTVGFKSVSIATKKPGA